jgi:hypothetical protein
MVGKTARLFAACILLASQSLLLAQDAGISSILGGSQMPNRIAARDLPDDYRAVELKVQGSSGFEDMFSGPFGAIMSLGMGGGGNAEGASAMRMMALMSVSWTKGETVSLHSHIFLVVYKPDSGAGMMSLASKPSAAGAETAQGTGEPPAQPPVMLNLSYIRVDSITMITPRPDLNKSMLAEMPDAMGALQKAPSDAKTTTINNFKQASIGMIMYMGDYDDVLPYVQDTKSAFFVTYPYVKSADTFKTLNPNGMMRFNMAVAGVNASALETPADVPMYYESEPWPDGTRVVAFMDGHVKAVSEEEWQRVQQYLTMKLPRTTKPLPMDYGKNWPPGPGG